MLLPYRQYVHTLMSAYRSYGVSRAQIESSMASYDELQLLGPHQCIERIAPSIAARLAAHVSPALAEQILPNPTVRAMTLGGVRILIPLMNEQGVGWYANSPLENFDFLIEDRLGLLSRSRFIYDFGAHHGVWSAYYAQVMGPTGMVAAFEPSILNVEIAAALYYINGISNVVTVNAGIGTATDHGDLGSDSHAGMIVDFVGEDLRVVDLRSVCWAPADFMKMDIEGYEYDIITHYPWIFDLSRDFHIELHIPHLEKRGLNYRDVMKVIPFDRFEVHNSYGGHLVEVTAESELEGYCSLMMKRR